jgi:hemerythrin-like domain-containing protein
MLAPVAVAVLAGFAVVRARRRAAIDGRPADVRFMRAMHDAFRRDLDRLDAVARSLDGADSVPQGVHNGWVGFRDALVNHHAAEDEDLWPALRPHLTLSADRAAVEEMVVEHSAMPAALDAVDRALTDLNGIDAAVQVLATLVREHLDHEERTVLPLLERHLTRRDWRQFLITERGRRSFKERADFLGWVLDDADQPDRDAVMAELPRPAHVVYRLVLRPRYVSQRRWQAA